MTKSLPWFDHLYKMFTNTVLPNVQILMCFIKVHSYFLYYLLQMSSLALNPIQIFSAGAEEEKAETARLVKYLNT